MAWVAEALFDDLSNGSVVGQGGGSGWSNNWGDVGGSGAQQVSETSPYQGTKGLRTAAANLATGRALTTSLASGNTGVIYLAMNRSATGGAENMNITFRTSGDANRFGIHFDPDGNIYLGSGGGRVSLGAYSGGTWYAIRITYDMTAGTCTAATSTGAYGSASSFGTESSAFTMTNSGDVAWVVPNTGDTGTASFDYISPTSPFSSSSIKTVDGLAVASVKTVDGLAIASVKTINGLA